MLGVNYWFVLQASCFGYSTHPQMQWRNDIGSTKMYYNEILVLVDFRITVLYYKLRINWLLFRSHRSTNSGYSRCSNILRLWYRCAICLWGRLLLPFPANSCYFRNYRILCPTRMPCMTSLSTL